jgi:hypothetical protein
MFFITFNIERGNYLVLASHPYTFNIHGNNKNRTPLFNIQKIVQDILEAHLVCSIGNSIIVASNTLTTRKPTLKCLL